MKILEVKGDKDLPAFIDLPWKIYKDYPHWVPPLKAEMKEMLSRKDNPFFKHSDAAYFIAVEGNEVLGRIAAIENRNHNSFQNEKAGFFGFFEAVNDQRVTDLLLGTAAEWCGGRGLGILRGPASFSTNDECGLLIDGFDRDPAILMPYNPPYYAEHFERFGLRKAKDLLAYYHDLREPGDRVLKLLDRIRKRNIVVRNADVRNFDETVRKIKEVYNAAWEKNWGFVPITEEETDLMAKKLKPLVNPELIQFAEMNGELVGCTLSIPDYNQVLKHLNGRLGLIGVIKFLWYSRKINMHRLMALGVKKAYRNMGIELLLCYTILERSRKVRMAGELSWILEDNDLMNKVIIEMGAYVYKKYRMYEMQMNGGAD